MNGARYAYLERLCELSSTTNTDCGVYFVSCDFAAPAFDKFRENYPNRYVSVGIAEQNMIQVACGLALSGKRAVAYSPSPFPVTRAFDQIKCAACVMELPITICTHGKGFSQPYFGSTHFNCEELTLLRTLPNVKIITPTDSLMGIAAADYTLKASTVTNINFDALCGDEIYTGRTIDFARGFEILRDGTNVSIITNGALVTECLNLTEMWAADGISAKIIDLYSLPFDFAALVEAVGDKPVLTVEEHVLAGGLGSVILETFNEYGKTNRVKRMGINFNKQYPHTVGSREYFMAMYGFSGKDITKSLKEIVI